LRDRLNSGGFGINVTEVEAKKKGFSVPKSIKLLIKGKEHIELVADVKP
jgi:hypothetical protein